MKVRKAINIFQDMLCCSRF